MAETFGQRLSRLRKEKGLTQEDIAKRIIISPQAVSKWENDISSPDILVLSSLADILGVSVDVLLGREEESAEEATASEKVESEVVDDDEKMSDKKEDKVIRDEEGIHVIDEKGRRVDIDNNGIRITDENGTRKPNISEKAKESWIINTILFGIATIGFILMGVLWTDKAMGWRMGWILFLVAIVIGSIINAIRHKKFTNFAYPILVIAAYCTLGFLGTYYGFEGWGFYWFLFITIPAFYLIFGPIDKYLGYKYHRDDDDDDDDDED